VTEVTGMLEGKRKSLRHAIERRATVERMGEAVMRSLLPNELAAQAL